MLPATGVFWGRSSAATVVRGDWGRDQVASAHCMAHGTGRARALIAGVQKVLRNPVKL